MMIVHWTLVWGYVVIVTAQALKVLLGRGHVSLNLLGLFGSLLALYGLAAYGIEWLR